MHRKAGLANPIDYLNWIVIITQKWQELKAAILLKIQQPRTPNKMNIRHVPDLLKHCPKVMH